MTGVRERDPASLGEKNPSEKSRTNSTSGSKLPEGFFDDRYKDAKARNVPYKDKFAEELEFFQKEMGSLEKVCIFCMSGCLDSKSPIFVSLVYRFSRPPTRSSVPHTAHEICPFRYNSPDCLEII